MDRFWRCGDENRLSRITLAGWLYNGLCCDTSCDELATLMSYCFLLPLLTETSVDRWQNAHLAILTQENSSVGTNIHVQDAHSMSQRNRMHNNTRCHCKSSALTKAISPLIPAFQKSGLVQLVQAICPPATIQFACLLVSVQTQTLKVIISTTVTPTVPVMC